MINKKFIENTVAWPFTEARKLLKDRKHIFEKKGTDKYGNYRRINKSPIKFIIN